MAVSFGDVVLRAWEQAKRENPDPFREPSYLLEFFGGPRRSYRERLHWQRRNGYGELIPRIVTVRQNLRALGKPKRAPRLPA